MIVKKKCILVCLMFITFFSQAQCVSGDCLNGTGTAVIDSSIIYTGTFKNGLPHGQGIFSNAFGRIYEGGVWKGLYHGSGKLIYSNGDFYIGDFVQGMRHGKGSFTSTTGVVLSGRYVNDQFISSNAYADTFGHQVFTNYDIAGNVFSSDGKKIAIKNGVTAGKFADIQIFDVETGRLLERASLLGVGCENFKSIAKLYLDFGKEYQTHLYDAEWPGLMGLAPGFLEKEYRKKSHSINLWDYVGKSASGEAIFWVKHVYSSRNDETEEVSLVTLNNSKAEPKTVIRPTSHLLMYAVSPDLKRLFRAEVSYCLLSEIDPKKDIEKYKSIRTKIEAKSILIAQFSSNGDSLYIPSLGIFSGITGEKIGDFHFTTTRLDNYSEEFSSDMKWTTGRLDKNYFGGGNLICLLSSSDSNYLVPLIDPLETEASIRKTGEYYAEMNRLKRKSEEKMIAEYKRQMASKYGPDWEKEFLDNPLQKKSVPTSSSISSGEANHTCQVCSGSGRIVDEFQDNLVQDKNSGRWYKKMGTVYKNCLRCGGKGYVTY